MCCTLKKIISQKRHNIFLIDYQLGRENGIELLKYAIKIGCKVPIFMLTAQGNREVDVETMKAGASDYIDKTQLSSLLLERVIRYAILRNYGELELKKSQQEIKKSNITLQETVKELEKANKKILSQQKAVIEEERLKLLLQLTGATATELNNPLFNIRENIKIIELEIDIPENLKQRIHEIKLASNQLINITKKIQNINFEKFNNDTNVSNIITKKQKINILSLEDSPLTYNEILNFISVQKHIKIFHKNTIQSTLRIIDNITYDIIIVDYILSDGNALDLINLLNKNGIDIPVVVITDQGNEIIASQIIQAGAYDYVPKAILTKEKFLKVIQRTLEKKRLIKEMTIAQKRLTEMSIRDELTKLYNRRYFMESLEHELAVTKRYNSQLSLCMLDIDFFKSVNDKYGHICGDIVLKKIASMIIELSRESDIPCRYGGEEFAVIFPNTNAENAKNFYNRLRSLLSNHIFKYKSFKFSITISAGIASYNCQLNQSQSQIQLISDADDALYMAKKNGRDRVIVSNL